MKSDKPSIFELFQRHADKHLTEITKYSTEIREQIRTMRKAMKVGYPTNLNQFRLIGENRHDQMVDEFGQPMVEGWTTQPGAFAEWSNVCWPIEDSDTGELIWYISRKALNDYHELYNPYENERDKQLLLELKSKNEKKACQQREQLADNGKAIADKIKTAIANTKLVLRSNRLLPTARSMRTDQKVTKKTDTGQITICDNLNHDQYGNPTKAGHTPYPGVLESRCHVVTYNNDEPIYEITEEALSWYSTFKPNTRPKDHLYLERAQQYRKKVLELRRVSDEDLRYNTTSHYEYLPMAGTVEKKRTQTKPGWTNNKNKTQVVPYNNQHPGDKNKPPPPAA